MVRLRFAPSPTGYLHVGGARTALFNWLYARKNNGKFIIRIEDTDIERSTKEFENKILEAFKWLKLDWDEGPDVGGKYGPYRQSERLGIYKKYIQQLINEKKAYYSVYSGEREIEKSYEFPSDFYNKEGFSIVVKFKVDKEGVTVLNDLLKGEIRFDNSLIDDFIILKSNGYPTYNFAVVIDDHLMKITHVFRGEDHLSNTQKQIMIYRSFGWEIPVFMHIPLILGNDKTPLSKRHGGISVDYFRENGFLNDALLNYLAILGWNTNEEIFNIFEKINNFDPLKISNKPVVFDYKKLEWINGQHIRKKDLDEIVKEFISFLDDEKEILKNYGEKYIKEVIKICREKVNTLLQLKEISFPFFDNEYKYEDKYIEKYLLKDNANLILNKAIEKFEELEVYSIENIEKVLRSISDELEVGTKKVFQTIRGAILGKLVTPGLFESIAVLGKEKTLLRLKRTLNVREKYEV